MSMEYGKINKITQDFWDFCTKEEKPRKIVPSEAMEARKLTKYLRLNNIAFLHIANERRATPRQIAELKAQGLQKGAPDYLIFMPSGILAIELKRADRNKSRVSEAQKEFLQKLAKFDFIQCAVCYGADDAINFIKTAKFG